MSQKAWNNLYKDLREKFYPKRFYPPSSVLEIRMYESIA
jgi:hypothetical protein